VKLRRRVGVVEDRGDHIAGVNATKMRGGDKGSPARSADIDLERCRVAAGVLLDLNETRSLRRIRTGAELCIEQCGKVDRLAFAELKFVIVGMLLELSTLAASPK
jgi:hypothetical protein